MTDDTSLNQDVTTDAGESSSTDNKEPAYVPSFRLKEETDKRRELEAKVAELEGKVVETDTLIKQERVNIEKQYAEKIYGTEMVNDTAVQEYKTKYPDLEYPQIFGALWIDVPTTVTWYSSSPSRPAWSLSNANLNSEYTVSQVAELQTKDPAEYKRVLDGYAKKTVKIIPW
jgi:hypothetical protein